MKHLNRIVAVVAFLMSCGSDRVADGGGGEFSESPSSDGGGPETCVEALADTKRAVDIILSIDQSFSMRDEIDGLRKNINLLPALLAETGLDYRFVMIAEVGRDSGNVCIPPPLGGEDCASNGTIFRAVNQHIESLDTLVLLLKTLNYSTAKSGWADFLRPGVLKAFVPITDDDSSDMTALAFETELQRRHAPLFGTSSAKNYVFFPVIGSYDFPETRACPTADHAGTQYQKLAKGTNGRWFSVCNPSFRTVLEEVGKAVRETVSCEVAIPEPPSGTRLDLTKINVRIAHGDESPVVVPQDPLRPCESGADGWQFSSDDKKIVLCGEACTTIRKDPSARFTVGFGCNTVVR